MCRGAAQSIFNGAAAYDQSLNAWNVGKVTHMGVRLGSRTKRPRLSANLLWRGAPG